MTSTFMEPNLLSPTWLESLLITLRCLLVQKLPPVVFSRWLLTEPSSMFTIQLPTKTHQLTSTFTTHLESLSKDTLLTIPSTPCSKLVSLLETLLMLLAFFQNIWTRLSLLTSLPKFSQISLLNTDQVKPSVFLLSSSTKLQTSNSTLEKLLS